jgi:hypothetical protein
MKRSAWLVIPWLLFIAAALGWVGYWFYLAGQVEARLGLWAEAERERGAQVSYATPTRHGFPTLMRLELGEVNYAPADEPWRATTARIDLNVNVLNPHHLIAEAEAPILLSRSDGAVTTIEADALLASLRMNGDALGQAGVEADNLRLDDPTKDGVLSITKLVANVRPDPRAAGEFQLALDITGMRLPRTVRSFEQFGLDVPRLSAAIVAEHGAELLDNTDGDPLEPWREAGGRLRFEALTLNWGPLEVTGTGQGGLDGERRLQGALTLPIERPAPIFRALAQAPNLDQSTQQALTLLALGYTMNGDDITLDVEANNGVMRLEGISVRTLPPVY